MEAGVCFRPMAKKTTTKAKAGSKSFNMRIPWAIWEQLEAAATRRGISVASLLLSSATKEIGVA